MTTKPARTVLPADVYDTLELSALAYGGIGAGWYTDSEGHPLCVHGHVVQADPGDEMANVIFRTTISANKNDAVVRRVNERLNNGSPKARIPFDVWCEEMNVVRGK